MEIPVPSDEHRGIVVYTAIFGDIGDKLFPALNMPKDVHLHAYVDGVSSPQLHTTGWWLLPAKWEHATNPRLRARRHKILSHELYPNARYTLWVDGCLTPIQEPYVLINRYLDRYDICTFEHMQRNCVYQEAHACFKLKKDAPEVLTRVSRRYRDEGYPEHNGLAETTAVLRRHTDSIKEFNNQWWQELRANSIRDQMSFDYLMWRNNMDYATFAGNRCDCPHFKWRPHR